MRYLTVGAFLHWFVVGSLSSVCMKEMVTPTAQAGSSAVQETDLEMTTFPQLCGSGKLCFSSEGE